MKCISYSLLFLPLMLVKYLEKCLYVLLLLRLALVVAEKAH